MPARTTDPKWLNFVKKTFARNLNPDIYRDPNKSTYSNVVAMVSNRNSGVSISGEHKLLLAFAKEVEGTSRVVRAINQLAEMEGLSGRLVDNALNMEDDYGDKRSNSEFIDDMSAMSSRTAKIS